MCLTLCRDDRHAPPTKKSKDDDDKDEEEDLNDANYDEVWTIRIYHWCE